jgi:ferredoxin
MANAEKQFQITASVAGNEKVLFCGAEENVFKALCRAGFMSGCGGGGCGICKVQITSGEFFARRMSVAHITEDDARNGIVLACCVKPKSNIELTIFGN